MPRLRMIVAFIVIMALLIHKPKRITLIDLIILDNYINERLSDEDSLVVGEMSIIRK